MKETPEEFNSPAVEGAENAPEQEISQEQVEEEAQELASQLNEVAGDLESVDPENLSAEEEKELGSKVALVVGALMVAAGAWGIKEAMDMSHHDAALNATKIALWGHGFNQFEGLARFGQYLGVAAASSAAVIAGFGVFLNSLLSFAERAKEEAEKSAT